jgi:glycosyltransferase involved in cell wall biosynthesis
LKPLRVLYLHFTGSFGGASRSLFEAVSSFPPRTVKPLFVTQRGTSRNFFCRLGYVIEAFGMSQFDNSRYGHYRGLRWLVILREIAFLPSTLVALWRAKRHWKDVDLIHVNEFSGVLALRLARYWFDVPAVVHVRSVLCADPKSWRTRWLNHEFRHMVQAVVAIDENVRASLPQDLEVHVIHNGFSPQNAQSVDKEFERRVRCLRLESFKVGFVGNLLVVKGILELIEAARLTRDRGLDVEFIIVGDEARASGGIKAALLRALRLQQNVRIEVNRAIDRHLLRDRVHLFGFTEDVANAYRHMNVLAFPSHYDAPGRPIFEAAFLGVPSIVAVREPKPDTLIDGQTGIAIHPRSALQLADAIGRLAADRALTARMGEAARQMAERNFDAKSNAEQLLSLYRRVAGRLA